MIQVCISNEVEFRHIYLVVSLLLGTLLEIVESLLKKDTFNLSSPVADVCKKAAHRLHD